MQLTPQIDESNSPGLRLLGGAYGHLIAAELVFEKHASAVWQTCFVNLAFSVELALKACMRLHGATASKQKSAGHSLTKALKVCESLGYRPSNNIDIAIIGILSPTHEDYSVRYLEGSGPSLPTIPETIEFVRSLICDIYEQRPQNPTE